MMLIFLPQSSVDIEYVTARFQLAMNVNREIRIKLKLNSRLVLAPKLIL